MANQMNTLLNQQIDDSLVLLMDICGGVHSQLQLEASNQPRIHSTISDSSHSCVKIDSLNERMLNQPHYLELCDLTNYHLTINDQPIKHYIGIPLITTDGDILGSLYVIDIFEKTLNPQQLSLFNVISQGLIAQLSLIVKEQQLTLAQEKNQRLNDDFNEFFHFASHDLKSPLNAIKNIAAWIEEDLGTAPPNLDKNYFPLMNNSINRMMHLLNGLNSYSKIGKDDDNATIFSLSSIVNECCTELDIPKDFNITINNIELELPKVPLHLILTNLISNAVKHHPSTTGNIHISGQLNKNIYQLSVTDDGSGIEKQYQDKIFKPFSALKSKDDLEGNGLGLSMIKKALSPYSGRLIIESEIDSGSTFLVFWPKK